MGASGNKQLKIYNNKEIGQLSVDLNKPDYYPGDVLLGNIWINTNKDIEVYGLEVKLQINERWWYKIDKHEKKVENILNLKEISVDIQNSLEIFGEKYILKKGIYNFPFQLNIPEHMQACFEFIGIQSFVHIRYIAYACLLSQKGDKYCLSNLNYVILKTIPYSLDSPLTYSSCVNVHSWLVFEKGTCIMNVSYPKNNYQFGEKVSLKCSIDNSRCKLKLDYVKFSFIQKINYLNQEEKPERKYENELCYKKVDLSGMSINIIDDLQVDILIDENGKINKNRRFTSKALKRV